MRRVANVALLAGLVGCAESGAKSAPPAPAVAQAAPASAAPAQAAAPAPVAPAPTKRVPVALDLGADAQARARDLAATLKGAEFAGANTTRDPKNAPLFAWLAATHADDTVAGAALRAMSRAYVARAGKDGRPVVDDDFRALVKAHLASKSAPLVGGALVASRLLLTAEPPHAETLATVLATARDHELPQARLLAVRLLNSVKAFQIPQPQPGDLKDRVVEALLDAADDPVDYVAAGALMRLAGAAYPDMPRRDALLALAQKQAGHADAAVRGRALQLAAKLAKTPAEKAAVGQLAEARLTDADPFVRSMAAEAVAEVGALKALPKLVALVDDARENVHRRADVKALLGGEALELAHDGSPFRRVDDAALRALQRLTRGLGPQAFAPAQAVRANALATDLPRAAGEAKAWFAKHGAALGAK